MARFAARRPAGKLPGGALSFPGHRPVDSRRALAYYRSMMTVSARRRLASGCLSAAALAFAQGCAQVVHVAPPDYASVAGKGRVEVTTREGRVYNFRRVAVDSARFVGEVDILRNVLTRDGHIEPLETTEPVRLPFTEVAAVDLKKRDLPGTALALGAGAGLIAALIRAFSPTPQPAGGGTHPPPDPGDGQAPRKR